MVQATERPAADQPSTMPPERDRAFALAIRRTLLQVVAMIEDHFGLAPINPQRKGERPRIAR